MREITIKVDLNTVSPQSITVGFNGEHKATNITFELSSEVMNLCAYYRVVMPKNLSRKLYAKDNKISYELPQTVLNESSLLIQLEGYRFDDTVATTIFKSGVITAKVEKSLWYDPELPKPLVERYTECEEELADLLAQCALIKFEIETYHKLIDSKVGDYRKIAGCDLKDDITAEELSAALEIEKKISDAITTALNTEV